MILLCKKPINNKTSGHFTQQSQIGIWSAVTTNHLVEAFLWWVSNMHDILEIPADTKQPLSAWLSSRSVPDPVHILPTTKASKAQKNKKQNPHQESFSLFVLSKSCVWPIAATLRIMQGSLYSSACVLIGDLSNMSARLSTHLCTTLVFH